MLRQSFITMRKILLRNCLPLSIFCLPSQPFAKINSPGNFDGTLGSQVSGQILAVSASDTDGSILKDKVGMTVAVQNGLGYGYASWDGTSMASPHVAGVAALVWSHHPYKTNDQIRTAL